MLREYLCRQLFSPLAEVKPRWRQTWRMVGNHWYSDSQAANGSVADGVFVSEEKWQRGRSGALSPPRWRASMADLPRSGESSATTWSISSLFVYQGCGRGSDYAVLGQAGMVNTGRVSVFKYRKVYFNLLHFVSIEI